MMRSDFEWFIEHYDEIYRRYGECYPAIREGKIIGVYKSYADGCDDLRDKGMYGRCSLQHCNGNESGYTAYINRVLG